MAVSRTPTRTLFSHTSRLQTTHRFLPGYHSRLNMTKSWAMLALATSSLFSTASASCVAIDRYLDIPSPLTGDMEINLDGVDTIECGEIDGFIEGTLETVTVDGGTLTLKSSSNVRFVSLGFRVETGANLVFDMPKTIFGPITDAFDRTEFRGFTVRVEQGASATFLGQVLAEGVTNVSRLFRNEGTMEFEKPVVFQGNQNVWRGNTGVLMFKDDATFKDNAFLALDNEESAFVTFAKDATFDNNAFAFDGAEGCSVANLDTSTIIFGGDATFQNNECDEGAAVFNEGTMTFEGKARFKDNENPRADGGGMTNRGGTLVFNKAVQFNNNIAGGFGGGVNVEGGDVTFIKGVTFDGNAAESGSAFAIRAGGSLTFEKPERVISRNAVIGGNLGNGCTFGEVSDGATLIGFTGDDVCVPADDAA